MNQKFFQSIFFVAGMLFLPNLAKAEVIINEVAWMGTTESQYEEWIELYNDGSATSLDGWKIFKAAGATTLISLSGNISAGQHLLVCRTTPSVPNPLSGTCDIMGSFGGSGLNNTSEHIILKNDAGTIVDSVDAGSGWPGGDASSKHTMQYHNSSWLTAAGTPGEANATSGDSNDEEEEEEDTDPVNIEDDEGDDDDNSLAPKTYSTRLLKVEAPKIAVAGSPAHFRAETLDFNRSTMYKGRYVWNMGDGVVRQFALGYKETNNGFDHNYEYPGTYSASVKYYHSFFDDVPAELEQKFTVEVVVATVAISKVYPDGAVELKNTSGNSIDLSGWQLRDSVGAKFIIPDDTEVLPGKTIVFTKTVTKLNPLAGVNVYTPTGTLGAGSNQSVVTNYSTSTTKTSSVKKPTAAVVESIDEGEVLGTDDLNVASVVDGAKGRSNTMVWILSFVILVMASIIAVMYLRKEDRTEEGYELIDE